MLILVSAALLLGLSVVSASASQLSAPSGDVVLTVTGAIDNLNGTVAAQFDEAMLDALASHTTTTITPWYDQAVTFKGPLASALLDAVGAHGTMVRVTAINDYSAEIPIKDFTDSPVILATSINGKLMSVRDKGPIFIIYPFDQNPSLYNEEYFGKSVWQVNKIEVH